MNITTKQTDDLNRTVTIEIVKEDYQEQKEKKLKDYRKVAEIKGFRKGYAPMSLIERFRGPEALAESINEVVSEALDKYIKDNELNVLGEPLPSEEEEKNDWENPDKFSFSFDMGLAPAMDFEVSKDDKVPYYDIKVEDKAIDDYRSQMLRQFGKLDEVEVSGDESFLTLALEQGDRKLEKAYVNVAQIADVKQRAQFVGKKKDDAFDVDMAAVYPSEDDRARVLGVKKEDLAGTEPVWHASVLAVKNFVPAEVGQEIYDKMFGKGAVTTEEQFRAKIADRLKMEYADESEFRLSKDVREFYIAKAALPLPEAFLKRWIYNANKEKYTMEEIGKEFEGFASDFRWQLISGYLMKKYDLKVESEDMMKQAKMMAAYQYAMYGLDNVPDEQLTGFAKSILSDKEQAQRIYERAELDTLVKYVKGVVTLDRKDVTIDGFRNLK